MKVDIHSHLWPSGSTTKTLNEYFKMRGLNPAHVLTAEGIIDSAYFSDIDVSIVSALAMVEGQTNDDLAAVNDYVAGEVQRSGGKLIGFCTVDPFGGKRSADKLQKYIQKDGFKGLKLHQNIQCFYPGDKKLYPVYEEMQLLGLPVLFHTGGIGIRPLQDKYSELGYIEEVACLFPRMPIILGHAGRGMYDQVALMLRKHENMYADVSANIAKLADFEHLPLWDLVKKVKLWVGNVDKLLFGSDYPFYTQAQTLELLGRIADQDGKLVCWQDIYDISYENAGRFCQKYGLI